MSVVCDSKSGLCSILAMGLLPHKINSHKISYPYIEKYNFNSTLNFSEHLDLRARKRF